MRSFHGRRNAEIFVFKAMATEGQDMECPDEDKKKQEDREEKERENEDLHDSLARVQEKWG